MPNLNVEESLAQICDALVRELSFALKKRLPPVATPAALRLVPSMIEDMPTRLDLQIIYVTSVGKCFYWSQFATAADNGTTVIAPADAGPTGRWLLVESTLLYKGVPVAEIEEGVIREVILHVGDFDEQVLKSRIFGKAPCVAIHLDTEAHKAISQIPGTLADYRVGIETWAVSRNFRAGYEASLGSPLPDEFAADPGVLRLSGKVKNFLWGSNLGIDTITDTVPLEARNDRSDVAERVFVWAQTWEIRGSLHRPDEPFELTDVDRIDAQRMQSSVGPTGELDLPNCITSGLHVPIGLGLAKTIAAGTAKIDGTTVTVAATAHTFTASTNTYRDLAPDGTWTFTEVATGYDVPEPAAGSLRVGLTVTDAAGVAWDTFLASSYIPSETPDQIEV